MRSKESRVAELERVTQTMVQGSLSEKTRQCGDPSCACARDPAKRHGPHLYLKYNAEGKTYSVYVPLQHAEVIKNAHVAWLQFQELGTQLAADNRLRLLRGLERQKQAHRAQKAKARSKAS